MMQGIYGIHNVVADKWYVGQSNDIKGRWSYHLSHLESGKHSNQHLQFSYAKYGKSSFEFVVLEEVVTASLLTLRENFWVRCKEAGSKGLYNIRVSADSTFGFYHSPETRAKLAAAQKGRKSSLETRAKVSAAVKGRKHSLEARARMSLAQKGRKVSPEARAKLAAANIGTKRSLEMRKKLSNFQRKFSAEEVRLIKGVCVDGYSVKEIAISLKCSVGTIRKVVTGSGVYADTK